MEKAAVIILSIFSVLNALIIWYFLIYKSDQADKEYRKRLKEIEGKRLTG